MKIQRHITTGILAAATLLATGAARLQATPNLVVAAFATGTQGENNSQDGTYGQYNGDNLSVNYGAGTIAWDGITFDAADGSTGSAHITANFSSANNTDLNVSMAPGYNNWYYEGGSGVPGWSTGTVDFTQYHAVQFDILWDTNSALTISQFNTGDGWPLSDFVAGDGTNFMATNSYYTDGVNVELFTGSGGGNVYLGTFQIPANASNGWQTVTVPYSDTLSGITSGAGIWFQGSFGGGSGLVGNVNAAFWIDNLQLIGNVTVSPPPTINPPTNVTAGLNIFNGSVGSGNNYYDRNEVIAKTTTGLSWVGNTPASYSFNMASFPNGKTEKGVAYMFLVPNSLYEDTAADYNESNCMALNIQSTPTGGQAMLSYKVAEPSSETYTAVTNTSFSGGPNPPATAGTAVPTTKLLGNYTLTFTGNDAGTLTTPDGTIGNFTLPAGTGATYFAETGSQAYNCLMYLGGQANDASYVNQSVDYQSVTVTGPPSGAAVSENFVADADMATPALQNWATGPTQDAATDLLVPTNAIFIISWSLPDSGYSLEESSSISPASWKTATSFKTVPMYNVDTQLISGTDLASPTNNQFFKLVHRSFSQLLVLLPGQTLTPGVSPGYSGTPTPVSEGGDSGLETFTVYAVDSQWNPISGITDTVSINNTDTSPNGSANPNNAPLVNGSAQFTVLFEDEGTFTITASDVTNPAITAGTSASVVVGP